MTSHIADGDRRDGERPRRTVLVVDDDENSRLILRHFLAHPRWVVDEAENGLLALNKVAEREYDVVCLDVEMPVMDGLEVAARIRASGVKRQPLIVGLSSHEDAETRERALARGCDRYFTKPVPRHTLVELVSGASGAVPLERPAVDPDVQALLPAFLRKQLEEVQELQAAVAAGDAGMVRRTSHRMGGSAAMYGVYSASAICAEIETLAQAKQLDAAAQRISALAEVLRAEADRIG